MASSLASPAGRNWFLAIAVSILSAGFLADQASKSWASLQAEQPRVLVPGYLVAYAVPNPGSLMGVGGDQSGTNPAVALLGIAIAGLLAVIAYLGRWRGAEAMAGALLLAGIFGNTVDRLVLGHVRDFLVTWAFPNLAFNIADLLLLVGFFCLLWARARSGWRFHKGTQ